MIDGATIKNRYLVKSYADSENWYRIYNDGWVEQGGRTYHGGSHINQYTTITFLVPFANTEYTSLTTPYLQWENFPISDVRNKTATTMEVWGMYTYGEDWYACGQGEIS